MGIYVTLSLNSELYSKIMEQVDVLTTTTSRARPGKNGEIHLFSKKVYCGVCGKSFQKTLCKTGPRKNPTMKPYLHCRNHRHAGGITCDNTKLIRYEVLEELVLNEINTMIDKYAVRQKESAEEKLALIEENLRAARRELHQESAKLDRLIEAIKGVE